MKNENVHVQIYFQSVNLIARDDVIMTEWKKNDRDKYLILNAENSFLKTLGLIMFQ